MKRNQTPEEARLLHKKRNHCQREWPTAHPGFKLLFYNWPQPKGPESFTPLARAVCGTGADFFFMWRRNILRRLISR